MRNYSRQWLSVLVTLLGVTLAISCRPSAGNLEPSQPVTEEPPTTELPVDLEPGQPAIEEPRAAELPVELKPSEPTGEEPQTIELPTDLADVIDSDPAEVENSALPITSVDELHTTLPESVTVDIEQYRLTIDGLVERPLTLTYEDIVTYPAVTEVVLLICPGFFADNAEWTGVPVMTLLEAVGIKPEASVVTFYAVDEYYRSFSLEAIQGSNAFLAHTVNGQVLPPEHGYPLRLVAEGRKGFDWIKWLERIDIS